MRLAVDASNIREGGGVTHLREILGNVDQVEHDFDEIEIWAPRKTLDLLPDHSLLRKQHHPLIDKGRLEGELFRLRVLDRIIDPKTDLLWAPGGTYHGSFRPFVTMFRNLLPFDRPERDRFKYSKDWFRFHYLKASQLRSYRSAAGVISVSQEAHRLLNESRIPEKVRQRVIHHGLSPRFLMSPRRQPGFEEFNEARPIRILYVSRVNAYKHQDKLIEATSRLRKKGLPIELHLVGSVVPACRPGFESTLRQYDPDRSWIRLQGEVPYSEIQRHYQDADLYAFMSTCEAFGNILLEAMAAGIPVLSSNRSAAPEIHGGACPQVDPENVEEVAHQLELLIVDQALRTKVAEAVFDRAKTFSWVKTTQETFAFLAECART